MQRDGSCYDDNPTPDHPNAARASGLPSLLWEGALQEHLSFVSANKWIAFHNAPGHACETNFRKP